LRRSSSRFEYAAARIASSDSSPGAEAATDGRRGCDEPDQHEQVAVAEGRVEIAAHHVGVEDEQCPGEIHDVEGDVADEDAHGEGHQGRGVVEPGPVASLG
jgi:hypothetical protein